MPFFVTNPTYEHFAAFVEQEVLRAMKRAGVVILEDSRLGLRQDFKLLIIPSDRNLTELEVATILAELQKNPSFSQAQIENASSKAAGWVSPIASIDLGNTTAPCYKFLLKSNYRELLPLQQEIEKLATQSQTKPIPLEANVEDSLEALEAHQIALIREAAHHGVFVNIPLTLNQLAVLQTHTIADDPKIYQHYSNITPKINSGEVKNDMLNVDELMQAYHYEVSVCGVFFQDFQQKLLPQERNTLAEKLKNG